MAKNAKKRSTRAKAPAPARPAAAAEGGGPLIELVNEPPRTDLRDVDFAQMLSALFSGWAMMAPDVETLRNAVKWWAGNEEAWEGITAQTAMLRATLADGVPPFVGTESAAAPGTPAGEPGAQLDDLANLGTL